MNNYTKSVYYLFLPGWGLKELKCLMAFGHIPYLNFFQVCDCGTIDHFPLF